MFNLLFKISCTRAIGIQSCLENKRFWKKIKQNVSRLNRRLLPFFSSLFINIHDGFQNCLINTAAIALAQPILVMGFIMAAFCIAIIFNAIFLK